MTTLGKISLCCSICGEEFESTCVNSCGYASKRTDFRPNYWGANPAPHFIHLCPYCGFCGYKSDFDEPFNEEIKLKIMNMDFGNISGTAQKYERAAVCAEIIGHPAMTIADHYLKASWWGEGDHTRKMAILYYQKTLNSSLVPKEDRAVITYLIGELYRRSNDKKNAHKWYNKVETEIINPEQQKWIVDIADQQKTNPQDEF